MGRREEANEQNEELVLSCLADQWMTAAQVAQVLGMAGKNGLSGAISHALARLAREGKILREERREEDPTGWRSYVLRVYYRCDGVPKAMFPHWLMPQVPELRIIKRTIFRMK